MNKLDIDYTKLLQDILDNGISKGDRTGTGTVSVFGRELRHNMSDGFPLMTTKKMAWKSMVVELIWFLNGDTNIKYLVENGCNIWNGDAYKKYEIEFDKGNASGTVNLGKRIGVENKEIKLSKEDFIDMIKNSEEFGCQDFANKWGDLGPIYGKQWRNWEYGDVKAVPNGKKYSSGELMYDFKRKSIDQIKELINQLNNNPDSRRLMVNAWNVGEISEMTLPPCHYGFQCYTRELSLEERLKISDKINLNIRKDLYSYIFNNPIYNGASKINEDDYERHLLLNDLDIPRRTLSLKWTQRSVDTFLGLPFNIASYGLLLQILAQHVNMVPEFLIGGLGDTHLYSNHLEQAQEQIPRQGFKLPTVKIKDFDKIEDLTFEHFELIDYKSEDRIKAPLSN